MTTAIEQKRISIERMGRIWNYALTHEDIDECHDCGLTFGDFDGLSFAALTFAGFLEVNRSTVQLYEEARV